MVHWLWHFFIERFVDVSSKFHHLHLFAEHFKFLSLIKELLVQLPDLVLTVLIASRTLMLSLVCFLDLALNLLWFWVKCPVLKLIKHHLVHTLLALLELCPSRLFNLKLVVVKPLRPTKMFLVVDHRVKTLAGFAQNFPSLKLFLYAVHVDFTELQRFTPSKRWHDVIETKKVEAKTFW